jgi:NADPH:quinone reductase-like Zn-dependent oxidoreductase
MKAIAYNAFGTLDVIHQAELPVPALESGHVLVKVQASSVNVIDNRIRAGKMGLLVDKKFPKIPGADLAGIVTAVGADVTNFKIGDTVFGAVNPFKGGAFAEVARVPAKQLAVKPASLPMEEAASLPVAGVAALTALRDLGKVKSGDKVLIHGGSGAVGLYAIQIAKRFGAHVTAVAGTSGIEAMKAAGADIVIDYRRQDGGRFDGKFNTILNASGALPFAKAKAFLEPRGVLVEPSPTIPLVIGSKLANLFRGRQHLPLMAIPNRADLDLLARWAADGSLRTAIAQTYPLSEAHDALGAMEQGGVVGKVVIMV